MLETLNQFNWNSIHHAYGAAGDIPPLIRSLLSQQKENRQKAIEELDNLIHHQGTLYEAAFYVAPYFVELLNNSDTPDKDIIAASFADLAKDITQIEESERDYKWAKSLRETVEENISLLYPFLKSPNEGVRWVITRTLAIFPKYKSITLPLLKEAFIAEPHKEVKKEMEKAINILQSLN